MNQELATVSSNTPTLTAADIRKQVNLIQEVMKNVMTGPTKENPGGVHYGLVPGCGNKPTLLKPGAEKLAMTFRLGARYEELPGTIETDDFICYKINCELFHIPTGNVVGNGRGTCNSKEKKYRTRMVYLNKATQEEKAIGREEERSGKDGKYKVLIVPQDPRDLQNTLMKMACKRAMIAGIINATAAGDIFTQDIEDLPEGTVVEEEVSAPNGKPIVRQPEEKKQDAIDLVSLIKDCKVGDKGITLNAYFQSSEFKQRPNKDKTKPAWDITDYSVADLQNDPTLGAVVNVFGKPLEIKPGDKIQFVGLEVKEYNGNPQYVAKEAVLNA